MASRLTILAFAAAPAVYAIFSANAEACTATLSSTGASYATVQAASNAAQSVDTITVGGTCTENVTFNNEHLHITIQGASTGTPTITGAVTTSPTLLLRAKGNQVQNLTVTGGSQGIIVERNANVAIQSITVSGAAHDGIIVDSMAYLIILGSTIKNNGGSGINIHQASSGRIGVGGWEFGTISYDGNVIQNNGKHGIEVAGLSSVAIYANTISGNTVNGINVLSSGVSTGGNTINSNGGSGIAIAYNSVLALGVVPDLSAAYPDITTTNNTGYGLLCTNGAVVGGYFGTTTPLNGSTAQSSFDTTCPNGASNIGLAS